MSYKRARVSGQIRDILSELLLREAADPRLHGLTVTEVTLDQEMQYARVYITGFDEDPKEAMQGLKSANSFLRREVARRVRLRKAPELHFIWDETMQRGEKIDALLQTLDIPNEDGTPRLDRPKPTLPAPARPAVKAAKPDDDGWDGEDADTASDIDDEIAALDALLGDDDEWDDDEWDDDADDADEPPEKRGR
jgi:ribosome-binding factor A